MKKVLQVYCPGISWQVLLSSSGLWWILYLYEACIVGYGRTGKGKWYISGNTVLLIIFLLH